MKSATRKPGICPGLLAASLLAGLSPICHAQIPWPETLVLEPVKDTSIYSEGDLSNGSGIAIFSGMTKGTAGAGVRRALLAFDLAAAIPPGSIIDSASLRLYCSKRPQDDSGDHEFGLHRLLRDWGEGASDAGDFGGRGAAAMEGDATWNHAFFPGDPWTTPGGDHVPEPSAIEVVSSVGVYTWWGDQLLADVQQWVDEPESNFGWILIGPEDSVSARRFESREYPDDRFRPLLLINYRLTWAGFPYLPGSNVVDTGSFLGLIYIEDAPWIWVSSLGKYIYLPESHVTESGGWAWIGK